ncbi:beta-phosphoglucomutase [Roseivirga pacifica]|uniref:Beta-phosphoglucomutase n=1 Tax=Roseivirga pacifica TaxID=1267423 RepID=A0A1I0QNP6_9BACT|nr:beta-phosphoglucomutase [Roseivirga pacifica]MCO6360973.1 beta-phosphoglucomutase [Roseivirga pacifica]MCO6368862.1 beta-phosphoglucomutase [Roseivirga pacifica]MCO6373005.1 beta-phosphoglucomutase [Roseivirga pacifica]MCO6377066.1 beta-phosphoglucomutase [Roseivirga pacifica]MCO6377658.1 beta-phosphoglucomutase [Roseivirga pacifica]
MNIANTKACIFDLDGVIVDTVPAHFVAWKSIADELGVPFNEEDNEHLKGVSRIDSMKKILSMGNLTKTEQEILELTQRKNDIYVEIISKMTPADILPGVTDFIQLLKDNGVKIAIGSSSKNTPVILKCVGLQNEFEAIVDGNGVTHSKPDPEVFLKGAEALGVAPAECVVFEDAISGVEAAKRGGMKCIGVGDPAILHEADLVIADMTHMTLETFNAIANEELH